MIGSKYVKVDGINTYYLVGDEGSPVILVHGAGTGVFDWRFAIDPLAQHHRVYALDMVGFGHSDKPKTNYTLDYHIDFLERFMDALQLKRASLVGQCFGGGAALGLAIRSPERIEKLVLANSYALGREIGSEIAGRILWILPSFLMEFFCRPTRRRVRWGWKSSVYDSQFITDEMVDEACHLRNMPGATYARVSIYKKNFGFSGQRRYYVEQLAEITAPTLIIQGEKDKTFPLAQAQRAHKLIKNSELHIIDACGHIPQLEKSNEFNRLVLDFLKKPTPDSVVTQER